VDQISKGAGATQRSDTQIRTSCELIQSHIETLFGCYCRHLEGFYIKKNRVENSLIHYSIWGFYLCVFGRTILEVSISFQYK
jgi:hypothetical protein